MPPGRAKNGGKKPQRLQLAEPPLHPYEEQRLRKIMRNNARLHQLRIPTLCSMLANANSSSHGKNKPSVRNSEDSESEYDPSNDDTVDGDLFDDDIAKGSKDCNIGTTDMPPPGAIKLCFKRVFAEQQTTRISRSKKSTTQPDANPTPSDICVPSPTLSQVFDSTDASTQATVEADGFAQFAENTQLANLDHVIACNDEHNRMSNEDNEHIQVNGSMTNGGEGTIESGFDNQMYN